MEDDYEGGLGKLVGEGKKLLGKKAKEGRGLRADTNGCSAIKLLRINRGASSTRKTRKRPIASVRAEGRRSGNHAQEVSGNLK